MLSRLFITPKPPLDPHRERRLVRKVPRRYGHPRMYHLSMDGTRHHRSTRSRNATVTIRTLYPSVVDKMLELHNYYRARHCARPLIISERLNSIAQSYALHLAQTSTFEHSGNKLDGKSLGENLYMQWISAGRVDVDTDRAVKSWYDEVALHNFQRPKFSKETGHFTQMVWKGSKLLGVGVALSPNGREVYFVTNYYPCGNVIGSFETNVLPASCK